MDSFSVNVYIPNLPKRTDRRESILKEFSGKGCFKPNIVTPVLSKTGYISLWKTFVRAVETEKTNGSDFFIFCEDDHVFTESYSYDALCRHIQEADRMHADLLLGGVSWMRTPFQVNDNMFWLDAFNGMQFTIVYSRFYDKILDTIKDGYKHVTDIFLSSLTDAIFVIYPFISVQKEFGYSDATPRNNKNGYVDYLFTRTSKQLKVLNKVWTYYNS